MLAFTLRMIIADLQKSFRGFWVIFCFVFFGIISVLPFFEDDFYVLFYLVILSFSALLPHITKIYYVLPFGSKLLRRYLHIRAILLSSLFIAIGIIISLLSLRWPVPNIEKGWIMIMFYVMIIIFMSLSNKEVTGNKNKKKNTIIFVLVIFLSIVNAINAMFFLYFKLQLLISLLSVIFAEVLLIIGLKSVDLTNYIEPVYYGVFAKSWREQYKQTATKEIKKSR